MVEPLLPGHATPEGTKAYAARMAASTGENHFRAAAGLTFSSIGIGTARWAPGAYEASLPLVLRSGINVVDTARVYGGGRSERAAGHGLLSMVTKGELRREEVFVSSKGGFVVGGGTYCEFRASIKALALEGMFKPDEITPREKSVITPRFIARQIDESRATLGLATLDNYFLHNPELQLAICTRPAFLQRIRKAFEALEASCEAGKIRSYGIATWKGLRAPPGARFHLSLREIVAAAQEVAGSSHHFRFIELPVNVCSPEAAQFPNQLLADGKWVPSVEAARHYGLSVLTSASICEGRLRAGWRRLLPGNSPSPKLLTRLRQDYPGFELWQQRALQFTRSVDGVAAALVGLDKPEHAEAALSVVRTRLATH